MGIINKCELCSAKSLFLKLNNGLCSNCEIKLREVEADYTSILQSIAKFPGNRQELTFKLVGLYPSLSRFFKYSTIINEELIKSLIGDISLYNSVEKTNPSMEIPQKIIETPTPLKVDATEALNETIAPANENNTLYEDLQESSTSINPLPYEDEYEDTFEDDFENLVAYETPPREESIIVQPIRTTSDSIVLDEIYTNTKELILKLNDVNISLNDLGKNYFSLKEKIYPLLLRNNITEVNGENIKNLLENIEKKLCYRTNQSPENLYGFFNYVTLSIQTTGIKIQTSDILDISMLKISFNEVIDSYYTLCNPMKIIKRTVQERTGITLDMLHDAKTLDAVFTEVVDFIGDYKIVTYNSNFTLGFIDYYQNLLFNKPLSQKNDCVLKLYRSRYKGYHGEPPRVYDIHTICNEILEMDTVKTINDLEGISQSTSQAIFRLYEVLKYQ